MERRRLTFLSVMLCATGCVLMPGCQPQKKAETAPQICTVSTDTIVRLQEGEKVPTCKINLDETENLLKRMTHDNIVANLHP